MSWLISFEWAYLTCEERQPRITKRKILAHSGIRTRDLPFTKRTLNVELLELINIDHLKVTTFYLIFLCKLPVPRGRCNNDLSCIFSYNICIVLLFDLLRRLLTVKSY